jgi:hypothetical protein
MAQLLTYTLLSLGQAGAPQLHLLHTTNGKFFVMGEVALQLFQQPPSAFVQELRRGKYPKAVSTAPDVLQAIVQTLGLQVEGSASHSGVMLLAPSTVEALLQDKRRADVLQPFRMAMLKLASQVRARVCLLARSTGRGAVRLQRHTSEAAHRHLSVHKNNAPPPDNTHQHSLAACVRRRPRGSWRLLTMRQRCRWRWRQFRAGSSCSGRSQRCSSSPCTCWLHRCV